MVYLIDYNLIFSSFSSSPAFPLFHLCPVTVRSVMYNLRSEQVQFGPAILTQPPDSILWMCNGNKVVEFTGSEETVYGSYEGRVTLNWHTAQLHISDLRYEDSGKYKYEVFLEGKLLQSSYDLEVIGKMFNRLLAFERKPTLFPKRVPYFAKEKKNQQRKTLCLYTEKVTKPTITCEINNSSSSSSSAIESAVLLCAVGPSQRYSPTTIEWRFEKNTQPGEALPINLGGDLDERQYTCKVSNPLSYETATFTAKDCRTGRILPGFCNKKKGF